MTSVAFSVEPLNQAQRVLGPVDPDAQRHGAAVASEVTPSTMKATRSSPDGSGCIISPNACSVAATNRRLTADFDVEDDTFSASAPTGSNPAL